MRPSSWLLRPWRMGTTPGLGPGGARRPGSGNEWRYVTARRFLNMVEESIKKATLWAVFEHNDAQDLSPGNLGRRSWRFALERRACGGTEAMTGSAAGGGAVPGGVMSAAWPHWAS